MLAKNRIVRLIGVLLIVIFPLSGSVFSNEAHAQGEIPTLYAEISFDYVDPVLASSFLNWSKSNRRSLIALGSCNPSAGW